eukprot:13380464-Ditylum_brightwellii.AAC.1
MANVGGGVPSHTIKLKSCVTAGEGQGNSSTLSGGTGHGERGREGWSDTVSGISALSVSEGDYTNGNLKTKLALKQRLRLKGSIEREDGEEAASVEDNSLKETAGNVVDQKHLIENSDNRRTQRSAVSNYVASVRQNQKPMTASQNIAALSAPMMRCFNVSSEEEEEEKPRNLPRKRFGARSQLQHDHIDSDNLNYDDSLNYYDNSLHETDSSYESSESSESSSDESSKYRRGRRRRTATRRRLPEKMEHRTRMV